MLHTDISVDHFYLKDDLAQSRLVILICCFFAIFLSYGDYLNLGIGYSFYTTVGARLVFSLLSLGALVSLKRTKSVQQYSWIISLWSICLIGLIIYINISRSANNINFTYVDTLIVLAFFVVFPGSIHMKGIFAGILAISDLSIILVYKNPTGYLSIQTICLSYALSGILGFFLASMLRQFRQKQYFIFRQEQGIRKELEQLAYLDPLTGALNRRKFFELGTFEFDKCQNGHTPFSIIMLDLDYFKNLNDQFGHAAGDKYLKEFTGMLMETKRGDDILARLGGEEFAIILPNARLEAARQTAERLRYICEAKKVYYNNQILHITISVGVTEWWETDRSFEAVLKRADGALYQAKMKGRNQVQHKEA